MSTFLIIVFIILGVMIWLFQFILAVAIGASAVAKPGCIKLYDFDSGQVHDINPKSIKPAGTAGKDTVKLAGAIFGIFGKTLTFSKIKVVRHQETGKAIFAVSPYEKSLKDLEASFRFDYVELEKATLSAAEYERLWQQEKAKTNQEQDIVVDKRLKPVVEAIGNAVRPKSKSPYNPGGGGQRGPY